MVVELKTVGLLRRSIFILPKDKCLDLVPIFNSLNKSKFCECVSFDENFKSQRIILKQEKFTIACFSSGKVMVYGLAEDYKVKLFLELVWKNFFCKNMVKV